MINISYTGEFKRSLRQLIKKYAHIREDIEPIIQQLQQGELLGDRIQHGAYIVYKVRVRNSDAKRGKSGGYRIIYYSKSEQADISNAEIKRIIKTSI